MSASTFDVSRMDTGNVGIVVIFFLFLLDLMVSRTIVLVSPYYGKLVYAQDWVVLG